MLRRFHVPLIRGAYLNRVARLQRRQDLPPGAAASFEDIVRYIIAEGRTPLIVSHRWLDKEHPDRHGEHLADLRRHG